MAANVTPVSDQSGARSVAGNTLAILGFGLSLLFPIAFVVRDIGVAIYLGVSPLPGPFPYLAFVYSAFNYYGVPVALAGLVISALALALHPPRQRLARMGVIVSGASLLFIMLVFAVLALGQAIFAP